MQQGAPPGWLEPTEGGVRLSVRVTPRARSNELVFDRPDRISVRVTAAPEDGKANAAVVKLLAKSLGIGKTRLSVVRGTTARDKTIEVTAITAEEVLGALSS